MGRARQDKFLAMLTGLTTGLGKYQKDLEEQKIEQAKLSQRREEALMKFLGPLLSTKMTQEGAMSRTQAEIASEEKISRLDRESREEKDVWDWRLEQRKVSAELKRIKNALTIAKLQGESAETIAELDREAKQRIAELDREAKQRIAELDREAKKTEYEYKAKAEKALASKERKFEREMKDLDRQTRLDVANIQAAARENTLTTFKMLELYNRGIKFDDKQAAAIDRYNDTLRELDVYTRIYAGDPENKVHQENLKAAQEEAYSNWENIRTFMGEYTPSPPPTMKTITEKRWYGEREREAVAPRETPSKPAPKPTGELKKETEITQDMANAISIMKGYKTNDTPAIREYLRSKGFTDEQIRIIYREVNKEEENE